MKKEIKIKRKSDNRGTGRLWQTGSILLVVTGLFFMCADPVYADTAATAEDFSLTSDYYALPGFESHMPILVLESSNDRAAAEQEGYFTDTMVYSFGQEEKNTLEDSPTFSGRARLRNMTDKENQGIGKHDYYLDMGQEAKLLGNTSAPEYLLLGAEDDKSLIRNYIGYTIAARMQENAPDIKLCEVFLRSGEGDLYQGVYSLIALPPLKEGTLFQRSLHSDGIEVETFSTQNDPDNAKMYLPFFEGTSWEERYGELVGDLSYAESVLYSTDSRTFYSAPDYFDISSFVDQFILGELMADYGGMQECYYYLDHRREKVVAAPIWNFEYAIDNRPDVPVLTDQMKYIEAPYFDHFFKSPSFASMIQARYQKLRLTILNEPALLQIVREGAAYVRPVVKRDWSRWDNYQKAALSPLTEIELADETVKTVDPFRRQTDTYEEELLRLRRHLREHNLHMGVGMTQFEFSEQEVHKEIVLTSNPLWPILFLIAFFLLVRFVRRYGM